MDEQQNGETNSPVGIKKFISVCEEGLPLIVLCMLVLFIIFSSWSAYHLAVISEEHGVRDGFYSIAPFVVFVGLALAYSAWFIACFTGDATPDKKRQSFRFAYAFTITAFVVLMIPVANPWQPDVVGPISLVRGCVLAPAGDEASVPGAIRCARAEANFLPPSVRPKWALPETVASAPDEASGVQYPKCENAKVSASPCIEGQSYPWLVTLGGFNGVVIHENRRSGEYKENPEKKGETEPSADSTASASNSFALRGSIIQGGFVVPFYVILLALVGGAVSLARRIPEYQKRSGEHYEETPKQPRLCELEVREVVVFQIMQLVSAPFIAVVAFYAIAPNTMNSAIGLAFLSGFASELILLQVRGIIEGLQPHATSMSNPVNRPETKDDTGDAPAGGRSDGPDSPDGTDTGNTVTGVLTDQQRKPISGAKVEIVDSAVSAESDENGRFTLNRAPSGEQHVRITIGDQQTSMDINITGPTVDFGSIVVGAGGTG